MQRLLERGQPHQAEFRVRRPNGEVRWCASTAAATQDGTGKVVRISGVTMDITERKEAEERQALLAREVDHRAKNAMAIVQSIVRLTKADSIADYAVVIEGRIKALSRAHALLSDSRWQGAELAKLVDEELAPYRSGNARQDSRGRAEGRCWIRPRRRRSRWRCMNWRPMRRSTARCRKRRASSNCDGTFEPNAIVDELAAKPAGPRHARRQRRASARTSSPAASSGSSAARRRSTGARTGCRARCACRTAAGADARRDVRRGFHDGATIAAAIPCHRIMIVEDEALVAMILEDQLRGTRTLDRRHLRKCCRKRSRRSTKSTPDAAILDVNLGRSARLSGRRPAFGPRHPVRVRHRLRPGKRRSALFFDPGFGKAG